MKGQGQQPAPNLYSKGHPSLRNTHFAYKLNTTITTTTTTTTAQKNNQMLNLN